MSHPVEGSKPRAPELTDQRGLVVCTGLVQVEDILAHGLLDFLLLLILPCVGLRGGGVKRRSTGTVW